MTIRFRPTLLIATLATAGAGPAAFAQNTPSNSNLQNTLPQPAPPRTPPSTSTVGTPNQQLQEVNNIPVHPAKFNIAGIHSVPFNEVSAVFAGFVGRDTTAGELAAAAKKVAEVYARHGYALSYAYVPMQDLSGGTVQVVVVEGYVSSLVLKNAPANLDKKIRSIAAHIVGERPLKKATFERYVSLVSRLPGIGVNANVPTPDTIDGATRLELSIEFKKYSTSAAFDANHPGFEGILSATGNAITPLGDQLTGSAMFPRGRYDRSYYSLDYNVPIGSDGLNLRVGGYQYRGKNAAFYYNDYELQKAYGDKRVTVALNYPVILTAASSVVLEAGVYRGSTGDRYTAPPEPGELDLRANVRAAQLSANGNWSGQGHNHEASLQYVRGSKGYGASQLEDLVDLDFTRVRGYARRNDDWREGKLRTSVSATVQHSNSRLPSTEKISFGGSYYAMAYPTGDATGDSGWAAAAEISAPIDLHRDTFRAIEPYAGVDAARVRTTYDDYRRGTLKSAILGVRLAVLENLSVSLAAAKPVGVTPLNTDSRNWRWIVQGGISF